MPVPPRVAQWVNDRYKRPRVDPQWLDECYNWLRSEGRDPDADFQELVKAIEHQILESNFSDSMLPGTGLPTHVAHTDTKMILTGQQIYVEVTAITEIGSSAFSLNQTRLAREERIKEGNIDEEGEGDIEIVGEGPMPKYSRGMLHFQLTDGVTIVPGIEYQSLPELSLENTPLGFKMLLKDVRVHKGIVWLEPNTVDLLGHRTEERDKNRDANFARGLRARMRLPEPAVVVANNARVPSQALQPIPSVRSPLREISPPPSPPAMTHGNDDEDLEDRTRRIPARNPDPPAPIRSSAPSTSSRTMSTTSSYFADSFTAVSQTLIGSSIPNLSLSPTMRQKRPNLPPPPPSPQPDDEHFWSDDENENLRRSSSKGVELFVDDFGVTALQFLATIPAYERRQSSSRSTLNTGPQVHSVIQSRSNSSNTASRSKGKGKEANVSSDEYDDDIEFNDDMIAELDAHERAMDTTPDPGPPTSTVGNGSGLGVGTRNPDGSGEVYTIEDDSDQDDKENMPVPTRHVRRRVGDGMSQGLGSSQRRSGHPIIRATNEADIIDLSD